MKNKAKTIKIGIGFFAMFIFIFVCVLLMACDDTNNNSNNSSNWPVFNIYQTVDESFEIDGEFICWNNWTNTFSISKVYLDRGNGFEFLGHLREVDTRIRIASLGLLDGQNILKVATNSRRIENNRVQWDVAVWEFNALLDDYEVDYNFEFFRPRTGGESWADTGHGGFRDYGMDSATFWWHSNYHTTINNFYRVYIDRHDEKGFIFGQEVVMRGLLGAAQAGNLNLLGGLAYGDNTIKVARKTDISYENGILKLQRNIAFWDLKFNEIESDGGYTFEAMPFGWRFDGRSVMYRVYVYASEWQNTGQVGIGAEWKYVDGKRFNFFGRFRGDVVARYFDYWIGNNIKRVVSDEMVYEDGVVTNIKTVGEWEFNFAKNFLYDRVYEFWACEVVFGVLRWNGWTAWDSEYIRGYGIRYSVRVFSDWGSYRTRQDRAGHVSGIEIGRVTMFIHNTVIIEGRRFRFEGGVLSMDVSEGSVNIEWCTVEGLRVL